MKAVIVEDEKRSQRVMQNLLEKYCPEVRVEGFADTVDSAINLIDQTQPDLLFLDIHLKEGTGFHVVEKLEHHLISVIFTTAYDKYAIKAFRFSAVDYLVKPIDPIELVEAVEKSKARFSPSNKKTQIDGLRHNLKLKENESPVLSISTAESVEFVRIDQIIRCEAQGAYCVIYLKEQRKIIISKIIKELESLLSDYHFIRIHQTHLINIREVQKYLKNDNLVVMRDGTAFPLARSRKKEFLNQLMQLRI